MDIKQVQETIEMIEEQNFDIRTITMGISLLDCIDTDIDRVAAKVYDKVVAKASKLVEVGDEIASELGIPIVNKRVSVTPISLIGRRRMQRIMFQLQRLWIRQHMRLVLTLSVAFQLWCKKAIKRAMRF